jgi:hypothetical protein
MPGRRVMTLIRIAAVVCLMLATPAHARNIINWQCGDQSVDLEVNKSTNPPTYDITFNRMKGGRTELRIGRFVWNYKSYAASLDGKKCREVPYDDGPGDQGSRP